MTGKSLTCYAPFRRSPPEYCYPALPLDLHVLSLPLAFILSQDQTLLCIFLILQVQSGTLNSFKKKSTLSFFVFGTCFLVLSSVFSMNFSVLAGFRPAFPASPSLSSGGLGEAPLFRNGIAKVGTFSEPANFFRTFFHLFSGPPRTCIILSHCAARL